jgi:cyclohexa-1,5-dienecarbonyl-CoA hydratase
VTTQPSIRLEERLGALWITLDRPPLNILDISTMRELRRALEPLAERRDLRVIVLRSAIPGTFSAGADVRDHARDRVVEMLDAFHPVIRLLDTLPQVAIAAVDGRCLGGGCELATVCDVVLATESSSFGQPEIDLGCFPPVAAALLPRLIGRAAYELVLTGAAVKAHEAARTGLVSHVVDDLESETERWVERLAAKSGAALALARRALRHAGGGFGASLAAAESIYRDEVARTEDAEEGVRAFLEKRAARWSHR